LNAESGSFESEREKIASIAASTLGRRPTSIESLAAGLGTRRFYRLHFTEGTPASIIARVDPEPAPRAADASVSRPIDGAGKEALGAPLDEAPTWLSEPALEPLRGFLEVAGLPVPRSYGHFPSEKLDLLEDVGDRTLLQADPTERDDLYRSACGLVPRLQGLSDPAKAVPAFERVLDHSLIETKAWKWLHWTIPGLLGREANPEEIAGTEACFAKISELLADAPRRLSHRDFKAENLHLIEHDPDGNPIPPRLVMIDVQGAFMAPPEYDLVCLLYDLQVDLDEAFIQKTFRSVLPALPDAPDIETASLRFDAIATMRLCKDISHIVYAARVRKDLRRWHEIPRGLALLERATGRLAHTLFDIRTLTSVIQVLTATLQSPDSSSQGRAS
jgi:aminoglycoside/choline kinase family phosphotransferase